jgi:hypothetical protein
MTDASELEEAKSQGRPWSSSESELIFRPWLRTTFSQTRPVRGSTAQRLPLVVPSHIVAAAPSNANADHAWSFEKCSVAKACISTFKQRTVPSYEAQKSASVERRPHRSPEMPWRT